MVGMVLAIEEDRDRAEQTQGNIEQRIFDKFPPHPQAISIFDLYVRLPYIDRKSVQNAVGRMLRDGAIVRSEKFNYRRTDADTARPLDARGAKRVSHE